MLSRRALLTGGMAGGLAATPAAASAVEQQADREGQERIAREIQRLQSTLDRALLSNSTGYGFVDTIREQMITFCRAQQKFPDFIEIGTAVFMDVYDWHVRNQQQIMVTRAPDGRYWLQFMFTSLVLRPEVERNYIGIPFDRA